MPVPYYDAHNHLQDEWLAAHLPKVTAQLDVLGLRRAVVNGTTEGDWESVAKLATEHAWVMPSFGLHPWHAGQRSEAWFSNWTAVLDRHPGAPIGEIGLDRWILDRARPDDVRLAGLRRPSLEEQTEVFVQQWREGVRRNAAITVHCIDAWGPLWEVLSAELRPPRGFLLHAYGGSRDMMERFSGLGAYFSFNGYFLGERKEKQRAVFQGVPQDRLLVETDAPAMPLPQSWRSHKLPPTAAGQPVNHPGNIEAIYAGLSALRGISVVELADVVERNFLRLFGNASNAH